MSRFGWDLPPGVRQADIDKAFASPSDFEHECNECAALVSEPGYCALCAAALRADEQEERTKDERTN